jgi:hypothetical protein
VLVDVGDWVVLSEPIDLNAWVAIFRFTKLSDLRKHCHKVTLHGSDLANLILAAKAVGPFCHLPVFKHHHPEHLALTDSDLKSFGTLKGGEKPSEAAQKTFRKLDQMMEERRMFCGHLFWWIEDPNELPTAWHFFHFDDKSTSKHKNHWKEGSHIHLMNHLTHPNLPLRKLLDKLDAEDRPWLGGGLHIRFNR